MHACMQVYAEKGITSSDVNDLNEAIDSILSQQFHPLPGDIRHQYTWTSADRNTLTCEYCTVQAILYYIYRRSQFTNSLTYSLNLVNI